jgi:uncharacterized metal-binding protein YceD (DUF177 family)
MQENAGVGGWTHATADIPSRGLDETRTATPEELAALAADLGIERIDSLEARYRIVSLAGGRYRLAGRLIARVVQACVVTLDPVESKLDEPLAVEFRPSVELARAEDPTDSEQSALEAEEYEPIEHGRLAVGRIVVETLTAALPQYPRTPDAALDHTEAAPAEPGPTSPFAALKGWKGK